MTNQQGAPEALRLAHIFDHPLPPEWPDMVAAAAELRRQHARVQELEAELEAVGAGGVQALSAAPAVPNGDELRRIARSARTSASDDASPTEYVLAGWKAAMRAAPKAAPGEPVNGWPVEAKIYKRRDEWVLELSGVINDCAFTCRHTQPGYLQPEDVAGLPSLYSEGIAPQQEARPCHVFTVRKAGGLTEWEPTTMALALPDGAHALYTLPQPSPHAQADSVTVPAQQGKWAWVPVEPSTAMLVAGNHGQPGDFSALKVWQDMIAALDCSADYTRPIDPPFVTIEPVGTPLGMCEHKCQNVTGHRGPSFVCQKTGQAVSQNSYCNNCPKAAPQPAPAPLSYDVVKDAARWRMVALIGNEVMLHPEKRTQAAAVKAYMDATHSGLDLTGAVDAAIAAQGGKA